MTEKQLRQNTVAIFESWAGLKESDGSHMKIINIYNSHTPLARGYKVKSTDAWCAVAVSAVAIQAGLTDIIPVECGCGEQIKLWKQMGRWQEADDYVPDVADVIYYDWDDDGKGDNTGWPDHVGMVVSVSGSTILVIEGNKSDAVGYRNIQVNGKNIRGYGLPDYASKATAEAPADEPSTPPSVSGYSTGLYKVNVSALNIRKGPGTNYDVCGCITDKGTYTAVEMSGSWGRLKSGAGWINCSSKYCTYAGAADGGAAAKPVNPYPVPTRTIYRATPTLAGDDVRWVQWELIQAGHSIDLDGRFGPASDAALRAYQTAHGLEVDGRCGPATRASMQAD